MFKFFMPKLSPEQQRIDDAIFSVCQPEEIFKCDLCTMRFELEHEHKYEITGIFKGGEENKPVHITVCECCAMDLNLIEDVEGEGDLL